MDDKKSLLLKDSVFSNAESSYNLLYFAQLIILFKTLIKSG